MWTWPTGQLNSHPPTGRSAWRRSTAASGSSCCPRWASGPWRGPAWWCWHGGPSSTRASCRGCSGVRSERTPGRGRPAPPRGLPAGNQSEVEPVLRNIFDSVKRGYKDDAPGRGQQPGWRHPVLCPARSSWAGTENASCPGGWRPGWPRSCSSWPPGWQPAAPGSHEVLEGEVDTEGHKNQTEKKKTREKEKAEQVKKAFLSSLLQNHFSHDAHETPWSNITIHNAREREDEEVVVWGTSVATIFANTSQSMCAYLDLRVWVCKKKKKIWMPVFRFAIEMKSTSVCKDM